MQKTLSIRKLSDDRNDGYVPGTPNEHIGYVWPLTVEVVFLSRKYDAEQRLQRHVTRLVRRKS